MLLGALSGLAAGLVALLTGQGLLISLAVYSGTGALTILVLAVGTALACRLSRLTAARQASRVQDEAQVRR